MEGRKDLAKHGFEMKLPQMGIDIQSLF